MKLGDHIYTFNGIVFHHGIYIGEGQVIHFNGEVTDPKNASIRLDSLADFGGETIKVVEYSDGEMCFPPNEVVARARSRIGEKGYSLTQNNCEHFARWCKTGEHESTQSSLFNGGGLLGEVVDRVMYEGQCSCGENLRGLHSLWLCRSCGIRYCGECIIHLDQAPSQISNMIGDIGAFFGIEDGLDSTAETFADRKCACGNTIDRSQRIRSGLF